MTKLFSGAGAAKVASLSLPETRAIVARDLAGGTVTLSELAGADVEVPFFLNGVNTFNLPAFCRVQLTVEPQINIEIWLPQHTWNGRFRGEGGFGYAGIINYWSLASALRAGYATATTDTGHRSPRSSERVGLADGRFALNADRSLNQQLIEDFASRSLHELVLKAKLVIEAYYGRPPQYSYWRGLSTGGRQGLMAIQRFPEEYDGVLAGCPAINWDRFIPAMIWPHVVMHQEIGRPISSEKLESVNRAVLAACGHGGDQGVGGIITNPRNCTWDPSELKCSDNTDSKVCLTPREVAAVRKIWQGPTHARTGRNVWFGLERGAPFSALAGPEPAAFAVTHLQYWLKQDPDFDWRTLSESDLLRCIQDSHRKFDAVIGTADPNLERFRSRGGKALIWHGECDEVIFPRGTLLYFQRVLQANGGAARVDHFLRLFMVPGIEHGGGDAPFPGTPIDPDGMFDALVDWVERGVPPDRIVAYQKLPNGVMRTRPLFPYPKAAKWAGRGSIDDAANFECATEEEWDRGDYGVVDLED